jgi:hypothetical protein
MDNQTTVVSSGGVLALAVFRADTLQVPTAKGGLYSVGEMTPEQLLMEAAQVTGVLMHLRYSGGGKEEGSEAAF